MAGDKATVFRGSLTARQRELLLVLAEEAGEVVQAATKVLRFGPDNWDPREHDGGERRHNSTALGHELGHLAEVSRQVGDTGLYDAVDVARGASKKRAKLDRYLLSPEDG